MEVDIEEKDGVSEDSDFQEDGASKSVPKSKVAKRSEESPEGSKSRKKKEKTEVVQEEIGGKQGEYFWAPKLHEEFMRHFSVYGKTWKVVSAKMAENGIKNKN
jgi:hypothetical protein